jgi:hypothetical protein
MMSTITTEQEQQIAAWLAEHPTLTVGVGTEEAACSVAAINLALTGELTDRIPVCMSRVIGWWIIGVQDAMPAEIRDSAGWRDMLPLAAGTGRAHEEERRAITLAWMWDTLALLQPVADRRGHGDAWRHMTTDRTAESARAAYAAAYAAADAAAYAAADADAYAAAAADAAAYAAADAAAYAAAAADAAADAAAYADADADAYAAAAADAAAYAAADAAAARNQFWRDADPVGCLRRLIAVTDARATP